MKYVRVWMSGGMPRSSHLYGCIPIIFYAVYCQGLLIFIRLFFSPLDQLLVSISLQLNLSISDLPVMHSSHLFVLVATFFRHVFRFWVCVWRMSSSALPKRNLLLLPLVPWISRLLDNSYFLFPRMDALVLLPDCWRLAKEKFIKGLGPDVMIYVYYQGQQADEQPATPPVRVSSRDAAAALGEVSVLPRSQPRTPLQQQAGDVGPDGPSVAPHTFRARALWTQGRSHRWPCPSRARPLHFLSRGCWCRQLVARPRKLLF